MKDSFESRGPDAGRIRVEPETEKEEKLFSFLAEMRALLEQWYEWGTAVSDVHNIEINGELVRRTSKLVDGIQVRKMRRTE